MDLDFDKDWVNSTVERLTKIYSGEIPDRVAGYSVFSLSQPNPAELFQNPELQFSYQIAKLKEQEKDRADVVPGVRPRLGCVLHPSLFGAEVYYPENDWPSIKKYPIEDIHQVEYLEVPDIRKDGLGPHLIKILEYFVKKAQGKINVGTYDNDGPLYLAFGLMGEKLLIEFYDHPDLAKKLLKICAQTIIEAQKVQREITGVPLNRCVMSVDDVYIPEGYGGIFVGLTHACMLSRETYREIVKPVDIEFFKAFGGGGIHTCGNHAHIFEEFADLPVSLVRFYAGEYEPRLIKKILGAKKVLLGVKAKGAGGVESTYEDLVETIQQCKEGGRFILGPTGRPEDIRRAIKEYGFY